MNNTQNKSNRERIESNGLLKDRVTSVDAFRGFTVAAMIIVNVQTVQGEMYEAFSHKPWHGVGFADLVYPSFLFIVGVSIVLSLSKRIDEGMHKSTIYSKTIRRAALLFLLGIVFNLLVSFVTKEDGIRIVGVLQRLSIVYLICVLIYLHIQWRIQIALGVFLLVFYWLAMVLIPVPSVGRGILEPGCNVAA